MRAGVWEVCEYGGEAVTARTAFTCGPYDWPPGDVQAHARERAARSVALQYAQRTRCGLDLRAFVALCAPGEDTLTLRLTVRPDGAEVQAVRQVVRVAALLHANASLHDAWAQA